MGLNKQQSREIRHLRIRKKISGTATCPRLVVFKSNTAFYSQLVNDDANKILASSSTLNLKLKTKNKEAYIKVGQDMAKKITGLNIKEIVFDRGGYLYHGKLAAFCDEVRKAGVKF